MAHDLHYNGGNDLQTFSYANEVKKEHCFFHTKTFNVPIKLISSLLTLSEFTNS